MSYRRLYHPGATYFFTVVTYQRQPILQTVENIQLLKAALRYVKQHHPFTIDAVVVLPDHLHTVWTLPANDANFSTRWRLIKSHFSRHYTDSHRLSPSLSRLKKGEQAIWQRRFWEHRIRYEQDYHNHINYIHYNPVKHGLAESARDWQYSSFHRFVTLGVYPRDWGAGTEVSIPSNVGVE